MGVNLKQLSQALGLSQTTVSRSLNGFPEVNARTRQRVETMARELNYQPSPLAKKLATGKSRTIGHVVPQSAHQIIDPLFADFIAGAGEIYSKTGYDLLMSVVPQHEEIAAYRQLAAGRRVDGVLVHGPLIDEPRIDLLNELAIPFVVHGRSRHPEGDYNWLDVNNKRAFHRATSFLIDLGHRRIGLINGLESMNFAWRRRCGYLEALGEHHIAQDGAIMFSSDMTEPFGYTTTNKMLEMRAPPTAILCSSILAAIGALRAIQGKGLKPGRDVSVITYDDRLSFLPNGGDVPTFTSIRSSIRAAGSRAAKILVERIENPSAPNVNELWEGELVVGASTGPGPFVDLP